ncbi:MAG: iron-containing alcohol dehydrogenase [Clostridia bacterium]|nr:iron-containing alcohol dehydrogenase [Clostridia bacterium]
MVDFTLCIPTKTIFGKDAHKRIGEIVREYGFKQILLVYGGESIKRSGLYDVITASLKENGIAYAQKGGVRPNPTVAFSQETADAARACGAQMILAVGGGSVIDNCKYAAHAVANDAPVAKIHDGSAKVEKTLPVGVVLTIAAAGSETSDSAVLTNEATGVKSGLSTPFNYPLFAVMNPALTYSVSPYQTACGVTDILMHTMERYIRLDAGDHAFVDGMCENLCRNVIAAGRAALKNPSDYDARATLMLAGSWSHNGLMSAGSQYNMSAHKLEHEMSAVDARIAHGAGLAVVWPAYLSYIYEADVARFAKYAANIWGCEAADAQTLARMGIECARGYFKEIGMPSTLRELGLGEKDIEKMADMATKGGKKPIAALKPITKEDAINIYRLCL